MAAGPVMNNLAAIVLAAGSSRRMPGKDKLLEDLHGKPLLMHCLETLATLGLGQIIIVTGTNTGEIKRLEVPVGSVIVHNAKHECGIGTSIKTGFDAVAEGLDGAFICLGDMPFVAADVFRRLVTEFNEVGAASIDAVIPTFDEQQGHPVLFSGRLFPALRTLSDDRGAKSILNSDVNLVRRISFPNAIVLEDIDTIENLEAARKRF